MQLLSSQDGWIRTSDLRYPKPAECQAFPHPEICEFNSGEGQACTESNSHKSVQRESNPHFRHGKAVGYRYIMDAIVVCQIVKDQIQTSHRRLSIRRWKQRIKNTYRIKPFRIKEHRAGLEPTSPHYESGILAARRPVQNFQRPRRDSNSQQLDRQSSSLPRGTQRLKLLKLKLSSKTTTQLFLTSETGGIRTLSELGKNQPCRQKHLSLNSIKRRSLQISIPTLTHPCFNCIDLLVFKLPIKVRDILNIYFATQKLIKHGKIRHFQPIHSAQYKETKLA